jgi:hypothetical protein
MDAYRDYLERPLVAGVIGLVIGLIIGWFIIGWWLWPVEYVGAGPSDLRFDAKVEYMRMAMQAYAQNGDAAQARARYESLGEDAGDVFNAISADPQGLSEQLVQSFGAAVLAGAPPGVTEPGGEVQPTTAPEEAEGGGASFLRTLWPILCVVVLVIGAVLIVLFIMRSRSGGVTPATPAMQAQEAARQAEWTDYESSGAEPPMAQYMASYQIGDDLFDDSFSIDSPAGEFLGECGVGISETIGVGDPKKVSAFEVWLFDKNDIQTVTKVLMSAHAFSDDATRQRLEAKGEPVLADPGKEVVLETQTLQLVARVVDMAYGEGALPPESFFDRFIIELAVWPKV